MRKLQDKIAIVTGAGSGFGAAIASFFSDSGAKVILADINYQAVKELSDKLGKSARPFKANVAIKKDIDELVNYCEAEFGIPEIVVNNAGTTHKNMSLLDVDEATFDRIFSVNVKSLFHMTQRVVPSMRRAGRGNIINIGSVAGIRPRPGLTWYNGSKGAVNTLSKSLAIELGPDNIRVNVICPVMGETALLEDFMGMKDTPENRKKFLASIPLGRLAKPSDVAKAAVFLASDDAEFLTGIEFPVDGGRII
jgi:3-oxoacyl-[acyl-carrier protein] reductase